MKSKWIKALLLLVAAGTLAGLLHLRGGYNGPCEENPPFYLRGTAADCGR